MGLENIRPKPGQSSHHAMPKASLSTWRSSSNHAMTRWNMWQKSKSTASGVPRRMPPMSLQNRAARSWRRSSRERSPSYRCCFGLWRRLDGPGRAGTHPAHSPEPELWIPAQGTRSTCLRAHAVEDQAHQASNATEDAARCKDRIGLFLRRAKELKRQWADPLDCLDLWQYRECCLPPTHAPCVFVDTCKQRSFSGAEPQSANVRERDPGQAGQVSHRISPDKNQVSIAPVKPIEIGMPMHTK
eukprot:s165_g30.t1